MTDAVREVDADIADLDRQIAELHRQRDAMLLARKRLMRRAGALSDELKSAVALTPMDALRAVITEFPEHFTRTDLVKQLSANYPEIEFKRNTLNSLIYTLRIRGHLEQITPRRGGALGKYAKTSKFNA